MKKILKVVLGVFVALIVIGAIAGSGESKDKTADTTQAAAQQETTASEQGQEAAAEGEKEAEEKKEPEKKEKYEIANVEEIRDDYSYKIAGTLTNNSGKERKYVQVEYTLYDADGNQLGTAMANVNNLKDGGTWKFEAYAFTSNPDEIASYELAGVTGF